MKNILFAVGALAMSLMAAPAAAEPATVMAPGGPGGGYDAMARLPFQAMQEAGIFTDGAQFILPWISRARATAIGLVGAGRCSASVDSSTGGGSWSADVTCATN